MGEFQMPAVVSTHVIGHAWFLAGACRSSDLGPDAWFPIAKDQPETEEAKRVCGACPVRSRCLWESLRITDCSGIWGGLDELDRRRLHKVGR